MMEWERGGEGRMLWGGPNQSDSRAHCCLEVTAQAVPQPARKKGPLHESSIRQYSFGGSDDNPPDQRG